VKRSISIPNILTLIRILLTPLFVIVLLRDEQAQALMIFSLAAISDGLDGMIARLLKQRTELGAILDPIADKLLMTAAFVSMAVLKMLPAWLTVIVISRDLLILLGMGLFTMNRIEIEIRPRLVSKCTTAVQLTTIIWVLLDWQTTLTPMFTRLAFGLTAALTIISGLHYIYIGLNVLQEGGRNSGKGTRMKDDKTQMRDAKMGMRDET